MITTVKLIAEPKTEADHQINVIRWSMINRDKHPELALLHHIPNGGSRDKREAARLKAQGVKPGVPDLFLPVPRGRYHGLYIEMKRPGGRLSDEQRWWHEKLTEQGYMVATCYGWTPATEALEWYLGGINHG